MKSLDENYSFEVTCFIIIKTGSVERMENFLSVIDFISKTSKFIIQVLEISNNRKSMLFDLLPKSIIYTLNESSDSILHRTYCINQLAINATSPFIAIWDADIIIPFRQIQEAMELLQDGIADFVYPYDKRFLDTTPIIRKLFLETRNIEVLERNQMKMNELYMPNPLGGAFFVNRESYLSAGMENEVFYGWGMEDGERFYRWQKLGYRVKRVHGPLYHLSHPRSINSTFQNQDQSLLKLKETLKAKRLAEATGFDDQTWSGE